MKYSLVFFVFTVVITYLILVNYKNTTTVGNKSPIVNTNNGDVTINYPEEEHDTWLRMAYTICTGPYNHTEEMLSRTDKEYIEKKPKTYLIKNHIFNNLKMFGILSDTDEAGVVTYETLFGNDIDKTFNKKYNQKNWSLEKKILKYKRYFETIKPDIKLMKRKNLLPKYLKTIVKYNKDYNEPVGFGLSQAYHSGNDISVDFYFRSLRTKSVLFENISNKIIKDIFINVSLFIPLNRFEIFESYNRVPFDKYETKNIKFPIEILKPGESIVFPLEIKMVPEEYASGYIYENDEKNKLDIVKKGYITYSEDIDAYSARFIPRKKLTNVLEKIYSKNKKEADYEKITTIKKPYDVGAKYKINYISFKVDGTDENKIYKRKFIAKNLIYINDNCECGSCPILFAQNKKNKWRRIREIITNNKGIKNSADFVYNIPDFSKKIQIKEYKGEKSYFSNMAIVIETDKNEIFVHEIDKSVTISYNMSLLINLEPIIKEYSSYKIRSMKLTGNGYYETESKNICPPVLKLKKSYFE